MSSRSVIICAVALSCAMTLTCSHWNRTQPRAVAAVVRPGGPANCKTVTLNVGNTAADDKPSADDPDVAINSGDCITWVTHNKASDGDAPSLKKIHYTTNKSGAGGHQCKLINSGDDCLNEQPCSRSFTTNAKGCIGYTATVHHHGHDATSADPEIEVYCNPCDEGDPRQQPHP